MTEQTGERIPRPEEIVEHHAELTAEQRLSPLGCASPDCEREATSWRFPTQREYPLCDEHSRVERLVAEANRWGLVEEITGDWLRIARAWQIAELEQLAISAHDEAKERALKAETRLELAAQIADAPEEGSKTPECTPEEHEEWSRLDRRATALNTAYTTLEDVAEGQIDEDVRRTMMLAVLLEEQESATEAVSRYAEGLRPDE